MSQMNTGAEIKDPPQVGAVATSVQRSPAAVAALHQPSWKKLFEALDQIESLESNEIRIYYRKIILRLSFLLNKITRDELLAIRSSLKAGQWQLGISLDDIPDTTNRLLMLISLRTTPLDVRMIEYLEEAIEDKKKKKKLVEALKKHKEELKSFSEKSLKYLKEKGVKLVTQKYLEHLFMSVKPVEYLLVELFKLQKYLQSNLKINPLLFKGFIIKELHYKEAIREHGSVEVNISRAILTGGSRVGKTSLKHYLLHNTAREDKTSTGVLEAPEVATIAQGIISQSYIGKEKALQTITSLPSTRAVAADQPSKPVSEPKDLLQLSPGDITKTTKVASETTKLPTDTSITPHPPSHDTTEALAVQDPLELLQKARDSFLQKHNLSTEAEFDEKQCTFNYLLDTGGQPSFQNVFPLLLDFPCNFLHVFKASERLTDPYINAYCQDGVTEERRANSRSTWELMKESITAAYTMSMKSKRQLEAFDVATEPQLRIFLVGTHLSLLPEDPEAKRALLDHNKKVLEEMDNKPYDGNRVFPPKEVAYKGACSYFVVDSQLQGDSQLKEHTRKAINALRSLLSDVKNQLTLKVPKFWFCLQVITSIAEKKMWKFTELKEFCIRCQFIQLVDADGQLLELLNLFHCLGFYVYFHKSEYKEQWICTDATFLYKEMSKVLSVQYGPSESPSPELRKFSRIGIIPESVSEALFQQLGIDADIPTRWLLKVLVHVGIAAKVRGKKTHYYFIPAALPERQIHLPEASVATLGFTFSFHTQFQYQNFTFIPTGLFHLLIVDIANGRQALEEEEVSPDQLRGKQWRYSSSNSDVAQFIFFQESAFIILSQKEDLIQLRLLVPEHFPMLGLSLSELCRHIRREMYARIRFLSKALLGSHFLKEKATLKDGVLCHCKDGGVHLLLFEEEDDLTGICSKSSSTLSLTGRESIWINPTLKLYEAKPIEFDGQCFLAYQNEQASSCESSSLPEERDSTVQRGSFGNSNPMMTVHDTAGQRGSFGSSNPMMTMHDTAGQRGSFGSLNPMMTMHDNAGQRGSFGSSNPMMTVHDNAGRRDRDNVEYWRETLQVKYWLYLLRNLAVNKIVDELYQGVEGVPLITFEVYDAIERAHSSKEANKIFMRHLLTAGTVEKFWAFCKVLHQTSGDYEKHKEILEKLKEDFNFNF